MGFETPTVPRSAQPGILAVMAPVEPTTAGEAAADIEAREQVAHERRAWVRLNFRCNDRCVFCLDADSHDGSDRDREELKREILDGRRRGATRLVLSGGEPTIHPDFVGLIGLGRMAGYEHIQTVSNGRMFAYPEFLRRAADAGLGEITFSIHGPNARLHDALTGTKGAHEQAMRGLENALADGRLVVSVDIVVTKVNVEHLAEMLEALCEKGVRELELLQVVPFGRAFREGRGRLFYDLDRAAPHLRRAFDYAAEHGLQLWLNRFPPQHLEGYEHLIQDPHKLFDEVRGRRREFGLWLDYGVPLDCREPARCRHCYLQPLCDELQETLLAVAKGGFDAVRVSGESAPVEAADLGGDPASDRRAASHLAAGQAPLPGTSSNELVGASRDRELVVCAGDLQAALEVLAAHPRARQVELQLANYEGLAEKLSPAGELGGARLVRAVANTPEEARALSAVRASFEVVSLLDRETADWLRGSGPRPARFALRVPSRERTSEARARDQALFEALCGIDDSIPVEGAPPCVAPNGRPPRRVLDTAVLGPEGRVEIFRFTRWFVRERYRVKSRRCADCLRARECAGTHVAYVRAFGFGHMKPIAGS